MQIFIPANFIDLQEPDPKQAEIEGGTTISRGDERAEELIRLGLAQRVEIAVANTPSAPDVPAK